MADEKMEFVIGLLFTVTAAASLGSGEFIILGVDLLEPLHTGMGFTLDYATVGSLIAVGWVWFSNRTNPSDLPREYQALVAVTVGLIVYGSYEPAFAEGMEIAVQLVLLSISLAGYWVLAHKPDGR